MAPQQFIKASRSRLENVLFHLFLRNLREVVLEWPQNLSSIIVMRRFISFAIALALFGTWCGELFAKPPTLPNIVIIFTDDQGYADVGVFGAKGFQTPNLDRLASQGCIFRNFHVAQPICS